MALTPEQKAERAKAKRAEARRKAEAERLHRIHLAFPWKRKTEGAGMAELDKLFSGAKKVEQAPKPTGHAGSKRHPTRPAERRRIIVNRLIWAASRRQQRALADPDMRLRPDGLGVADRVMSYTGVLGYDMSRLTGPQRRRIRKKLNHAMAAHKRVGSDLLAHPAGLGDITARRTEARTPVKAGIQRVPSQDTPGLVQKITIRPRMAGKLAERARGGRRGV
jgi:hypothetical protein